MTAGDNNERTVTLVSLDDQHFELPLAAARYSGLVWRSLGLDDDGGEVPEPPNEPLNLLRVRGDALRKVVEFLKHHKTEPMREISVPLSGGTFEEVIDQQFYQEFVSDENLPDGLLFEVINAANYMEINSLLDLATLKVTFNLQGRSAEEIRSILSLPELTPEEETQAREEHRWIFEEA